MRTQLVRLPFKIQASLFLIREELKSRKLFMALHDIGLDDCYFQPHLDSLIMDSIGIDDPSDETFHAYCNILDRRSKKISPDSDSIMTQAFKAYNELVALKKTLENKQRN